MKDYAPIYRFGKQLQTKRAEDFGAPDEFRVFQNARVRDGLLTRREGKALIAVAGTDAAALNFDGSADYVGVPLDLRVWTLGTRFSLRMIVKMDDAPAGNEYIIGWGGAGDKPLTLHWDSSRILHLNVWDSGGSNTEVVTAAASATATALPVLVVRDGASLSLYVNNTVATGTMSATLALRTPTADLRIGCHNGANFFDGDIDHLTLFSTALADNADGMLRVADARAPDVLAHYTMEKDANEYVEDKSRYGNTGLAVSTPSSATTLAVQDAVVQGMTGFLDRTGKRRMLTVVGGRVYAPELV